LGTLSGTHAPREAREPDVDSATASTAREPPERASATVLLLNLCRQKFRSPRRTGARQRVLMRVQLSLASQRRALVRRSSIWQRSERGLRC
jgi:hypothetical protein